MKFYSLAFSLLLLASTCRAQPDIDTATAIHQEIIFTNTIYPFLLRQLNSR
jgi:hypothetical protein